MKRLFSIVTVFILMALIPLSGNAAINVKRRTTTSTRIVTTAKKVTSSYNNSTKRTTTTSRTSYSSPSYVSRTTPTRTSYNTSTRNRTVNAYYSTPSYVSRNTVRGRTYTPISRGTSKTSTTKTSTTKTSTNKTSSSTTRSSSSSQIYTPAKVAVKSVSLNETYVNMLGEPVILKAIVIPPEANQQVTWSTSNASVATVSLDGKVTPVGYGTCTITATSDNGKIAQCTIEIKQNNYFSAERVVFEGLEEPLKWCKYRLTDRFTVIVDGVDGITGANVETDVQKRGFSLTTIKSEEKVISKARTSAVFQTKYTLSSGAGTIFGNLTGIKWFNGGILDVDWDRITRTYEMDNKGNLRLIDYRFDD